jgi:hypothetical protein
MPTTIHGIDFTVGRRTYRSANAFTSRNPTNPHNLPQSFIFSDCEIEVSWQTGTQVFSVDVGPCEEVGGSGY